MVGCVADKDSSRQATAEAFERITTHVPFDEGLKPELASFIKKLFRKAKPHTSGIPFPSSKSCYSQSGKNGGAAIVLKRRGYEDKMMVGINRMLMAQTWAEQYIQNQDWAAEDARESFQSLLEKVDKNSDKWHIVQDILALADDDERGDATRSITFNHRPGWERCTQKAVYSINENRLPKWWSELEDRMRPLDETFRETLFEARFCRKAKILPILENSGKVRVATVHTAEVAWCARAMTKHLLPYLKRVSVSKDTLHAPRDIWVESAGPGSIAYSADLSKSTDPISIQLSQFVFEEFFKYVPKPSWWDQAQAAVIAPHKITFEGDERETACGALMGLGPGWFVLALVNAFCADQAGATEGSFKVCGDDLFGLWPKDMCDRYEVAIARMGLQSNREKSYRGRHGVFCERFAERVDDDTVRIWPRVRIGEAVGAKKIGEHKGIRAEMRPTGRKPIRDAIRRTNLRTSPDKNLPGLVRFGGGGLRPADHLTVLSYLRFGAPAASSKFSKSPQLQNLREVLRTAPLAKGSGISARDLLTESQTELEFQYRYRQGAATRAPEPLKTKTYQGTQRYRRSVMKALCGREGGAIGAFDALIRAREASEITLTLRSSLGENTIRHALRKRRFSYALRRIQNSWKNEISCELAKSSFLSSHPEPIVQYDSALQPRPKAWDSTPPLN
jgi:hypothetical protein